jgi:hypothetical protein
MKKSIFAFCIVAVFWGVLSFQPVKAEQPAAKWKVTCTYAFPNGTQTLTKIECVPTGDSECKCEGD